MLCDRCRAEIDRDGRPPEASAFALYIVDQDIRLPRLARRILSILWDRRDRIVTRESLMTILYSGRYDDPPSDKSLDVQICHIRKELVRTPIKIQTIYGEGWKLLGADNVDRRG